MSGPTVDESSRDAAEAAADETLPVNVRVLNGISTGLASVVLAVISCLLVPLQVEPVPIPVSFVLTVAGNVLLPVLMKWGTEVAMTAAVPAVAWFVITLMAATRTSEGDLIVAGTGYGIVYLLVGALSAALGVRAVWYPLPWSAQASGVRARGGSGSRGGG